MPTPSPHLLTLLERLSRLIRQAEFSTGLNPAQWEALSYLSKCNRFSNTPSALTHYMGSTKGTISQSLMALERKKLITKEKSQKDPRKTHLHLTKAAKKLLQQQAEKDGLTTSLQTLTKDQQGQLQQTLEHVLRTELSRRGHATFGMCKSCRHFNAHHDRKNATAPHLCGLLKVPLSNQDKEQICAEHTPAL